MKPASPFSDAPFSLKVAVWASHHTIGYLIRFHIQ